VNEQNKQKIFMRGHSQGAKDILEMLKKTYEANPDCTVEEVMKAVDQMLLTLSAPVDEPLIVVRPGIRQ